MADNDAGACRCRTSAPGSGGWAVKSLGISPVLVDFTDNVLRVAMQSAPISHVAPARELATLVGAYFGSPLLREQGTSERLVGAALIVIGVVSLAFAR